MEGAVDTRSLRGTRLALFIDILVSRVDVSCKVGSRHEDVRVRASTWRGARWRQEDGHASNDAPHLFAIHVTSSKTTQTTPITHPAPPCGPA